MGAWGTGIMDNDTARDLMSFLMETENKEEFIREIFNTAKYIFSKIWAVEMIDISLNGVDEKIIENCDEYKDVFSMLEKCPMLDLAEKALDAVFIIYWEEESMEWGTVKMKRARRKMLRNIAKRLYKFVPNYDEKDLSEIGIKF